MCFVTKIFSLVIEINATQKYRKVLESTQRVQPRTVSVSNPNIDAPEKPQ